MSYDLHLGTEIGRLQERRGVAGKKEELCLLLRHRRLEPGGTMRGLESVGPGMGGRSLPLVIQTLA